MPRTGWILLAALLFGAWTWSQRGDGPATRPPVAEAGAGREASASAGLPAFLPPEAEAVLERIARDGAHPYRQDGGVFQNREGLLPERPRGHYREYTVARPGARDRGPLRIVTGGNPPTEFYYTADHYRSFRRFRVAGADRP